MKLFYCRFYYLDPFVEGIIPIYADNSEEASLFLAIMASNIGATTGNVSERKPD